VEPGSVVAKAFPGKLVVAISSRALFNLDDSHRIYIEQGVDAYRHYQIEHEDEVLEPGDAFHLVKKLLNLNSLIGKKCVEVILLSRNSADTVIFQPLIRTCFYPLMAVMSEWRSRMG
jgi:5'-nucleotidase